MKEKLTRDCPQSTLYHHYNKKLTPQVERGSKGMNAMTLPERTMLGKRPPPNQKAESESGATKLENILPAHHHPPIHKIPRTNHLHKLTLELAHIHWEAYFLLFSQQGPCPGLFLFLQLNRNLLYSHSDSSLKSFLGESRTWRSPGRLTCERSRTVRKQGQLSAQELSGSPKNDVA